MPKPKRFPTIEAPQPELVPRIRKPQIGSFQIEARSISDIISTSPRSNALGTGNTNPAESATQTVTNGQYFTFSTKYSSSRGSTLALASPDVSVYHDSISEATRYPNATINMSNFPVSIWTDWGSTNNVNVVIRISVYNNTGSDQEIVTVSRVRYTSHSIPFGADIDNTDYNDA